MKFSQKTQKILVKSMEELLESIKMLKPNVLVILITLLTLKTLSVSIKLSKMKMDMFKLLIKKSLNFFTLMINL